MSVTVTSVNQIKIVEILPNNTGSASDAKRTVTHEEYDESASLNSGSTPPVTTCALFLLALSAGAATVNLRTLTGTNNGAVDLNGLKVQRIRIKNLGANNITIVPGASNGIDLFGAGSSITIPPDSVFRMDFYDNAPDVSDTDKTLDVTGTLAQTSEWTIVAG